MLTDSFWWPLTLSAPEEAAVRSFHKEMARGAVWLNVGRVTATSDLLAGVMARHVGDIIARDGLPHLCHVVNGWGNGWYAGRRLLDRYADFVHWDGEGRPFVLQKDPEGEFHPWQSFAYAVMAGVDAGYVIGPQGVTLGELAQTSRALNTSAGHELGHLLYAAAYLGGDSRFGMLDHDFDLAELTAIAVETHHHGSFEVCRKFHLTEGLCAVAARVPHLSPIRRAAQGFLNGQLDILFVVGTIVAEASRVAGGGADRHASALLGQLRESLILGDFLENHFYYAGHLIELATLAAELGYDVQPVHWHAMAYITNELNGLLPAYVERLAFPDCFLHFGHYRRAITLLSQVMAEPGQFRTEGLAHTAYAVDFDRVPPLPFGDPSAVRTDVYELEVASGVMRDRFADIVARYAEAADPDLAPRGGFPHFRRAGPSSWPRAVHYEMLDYGDSVGVELHLESDAVLPLQPLLLSFVAQLSDRFRPEVVEWDPTWWKARGRLRVRYGNDRPAAEVAGGMSRLIEATYPAVDRVAHRLPIRPDPVVGTAGRLHPST
jgi:hypothetical protein